MPAEDDVRRAVFDAAAKYKPRYADDHVVDTVAVEVTRVAHGTSEQSVFVRAGHHEAQCPVAAAGGEELEERETWRERLGRAVDHVTLASEIDGGIGLGRPDDDVVETVVVQIARRTDRHARVVAQVD